MTADDARRGARTKKPRRGPDRRTLVFRVARTRAFLSAAVLGCIGAALAAGVARDNLITAIAGFAGAAAGWAVGRRFRTDYCSEPSCAASLPMDARRCPGCGGRIVGTIRDPNERLDALEKIEGSRRALAVSSRYDGQPMLIIIDNYALAVIGHLAPDAEEKIRAVVRQTFGGDDDWQATVRETMGWPANVDDEVRTNWSSFQEMARDQNLQADPVAFAHSFGDEFSRY